MFKALLEVIFSWEYLLLMFIVAIIAIPSTLMLNGTIQVDLDSTIICWKMSKFLWWLRLMAFIQLWVLLEPIGNHVDRRKNKDRFVRK